MKGDISMSFLILRRLAACVTTCRPDASSGPVIEIHSSVPCRVSPLEIYLAQNVPPVCTCTVYCITGYLCKHDINFMPLCE